MDRNRFNAEVRPSLTEIPIGTQGIAFDRLELDAWADEYKGRNGRPGQRKGALIWDAKERRASSTVAVSGTSTNASGGGEFAKALAQLHSKRPSASSPAVRRKSAMRASTGEGPHAPSSRRPRSSCWSTGINEVLK